MASTTSLLRSAASTRAQLADYRDRLMSFQYSNSAYTDSAFNEYSTYLQGRIDDLMAAGGIPNISKALSLTESLRTAQKQNMSANIQRENIQIMAGNASLTDKYNLVAQQFTQAQAMGDDTLAQQLMSQAYSISQSIQYQAQAASSASITLAKSNVTAVKDSLSALNASLKGVGQKAFNSTIADWVSSNSSALAQLGVVIPKGAQPNYWDIVNGVMGAEYNHYMTLATALAPTDPSGAYAAQLEAQSLMNGGTSVSTLGGNLTAQQVQEAAANPAMFAYNEATSKFELTKPTGLQYATDANGNPTSTVEPTYGGNLKQTIFLSPTQLNQVNALGLNITGDAGSKKDANGKSIVANGVEVQATQNTPQWVRNILGENGITNLYATDRGLEFEADTETGKGIYTIATDNKGLLGLFESAPDGNYKTLGGQYGFSESQNSFTMPPLPRGTAPSFNLSLGTTNAHSILTNATSHYQLPSLPPISTTPSLRLPSISIAPSPHPAVPKVVSVQPHTVNPQPAAKGNTIQNASSVPIQGGFVNPQSNNGSFWGGLQ